MQKPFTLFPTNNAKEVNLVRIQQLVNNDSNALEFAT